MSQSPEEIREEIELTRSNVGTDVDALADRVNPSSIMHRQGDKVRGSMDKVKDAVMGSSNEGSSAQDAAKQAGEVARDAPGRALGQTRGNPLAAGLIAFGAGLLVSSIIPPSQKEKDAAAALKEKAEPLPNEVTNAAKQVGQNMKEPAQEAAESLKDSATGSAQKVKGDANSEASGVKDRAADAKSTVQDS